MLEVQNEDSHFFWTFDKKNTPPQRWEALKQLYGAWLEKKYGSLDKAISAWPGVRVSGDDPAAGKMELFLERFDVSEVIGDVSATIAPLARKNSNELVVECADDVGEIVGDGHHHCVPIGIRLLSLHDPFGGVVDGDRGQPQLQRSSGLDPAGLCPT